MSIKNRKFLKFSVFYEEIATIYFNKKEVKNDVINIILNSYKIVDKKCEKPELIKQIIK